MIHDTIFPARYNEMYFFIFALAFLIRHSGRLLYGRYGKRKRICPVEFVFVGHVHSEGIVRIEFR